jgi:hypothetical protein
MITTDEECQGKLVEISKHSAIDNGKSDELGSGPNWKKNAHFKKLQSSSIVFQNNLAFLG